MQRFHSPLISLARLRHQRQRMQELELARRQSERAALADALANLRRDSQVETDAAAAALQRGLTAAELLAFQQQQAVRQQELRQFEARQQAAETQVHSATQALQQVVAEATVVERLLARQRTAHRAEARQQEQASLDEQTSRRWPARRSSPGAEACHD